MHNITIICTVHSEIGKCNSRELDNIIEECKPEIIFEELSLAAYNQCYGIQNRITLETSAIKIYLQNHTVEHIPVVGSELNKDLNSKLEVMIKYEEYRDLMDILISLEEKYGFQFLNSDQCDELHEKIITFEKLILKDNGDIVLSRLIQLGNETIDNYENEIINNIYQYSSENKYNRALMFIGAAHRKSIRQKIQEYERADKLKLNWTLYKTQGFNPD
jgi:hypothetical protein